jgi:hypothetical protein
MNNKNTMKKIYILATSNTSKLGSHNGVLEYAPLFGFDLFDKNKNFRHNPVHIYITNNFEIEDGDLCIYDHNNTLILKKENVDKYGIIRLNNIGYPLNYCKKIILTTDEILIKQGVQKIEEDFLQWLIKNPNYEFIEVKEELEICFNCEWNYDSCPNVEECLKNKYKMIIPKEKLKQELLQLGTQEFSDLESLYFDDKSKEDTLEKVAQWIINNRYTRSEFEKVSDSEMYYTIIDKVSKLQQKRIYNEEDLKIKIYECLGYFAHKHNIIINGNDLDDWFKENIK